MSLTREQLLVKIQRGIPSSLTISDPAARQCFEALREAVLMLASADAETEVSQPISYGGAGSIVKSSKNRMSLENDADSPGSNKVYGTNADGERCWKDDPVFEGEATGGGAITELPAGLMSILLSEEGKYQLVGDEDAPGNNKFYGTSATGVKGFHDVPQTLIPRWSIVKDASGNLNLAGDASAPANSTYYGKNSGGTMGFHSVPAGLPSGNGANQVLFSDGSSSLVWRNTVTLYFS